jgi:hypothetical protein
LAYLDKQPDNDKDLDESINGGKKMDSSQDVLRITDLESSHINQTQASQIKIISPHSGDGTSISKTNDTSNYLQMKNSNTNVASFAVDNDG